MLQQWLIEWASFVKDIIVAISAGVVAITGLRALSNWRAELTGRAAHERAREIVLLAHRFRDELDHARSLPPYVYTSSDDESGKEMERQGKIAEESRATRELDERVKRQQALQVTLRELNQVTWEADIILDKRVDNFIQPFRDIFDDLSKATDQLVEYQIRREDVPSTLTEDMFEEARGFEQIVYGRNDEVSQSVDESLDALKQFLKKFIKK